MDNVAYGRQVLAVEARAVERLVERVDDAFDAAVHLILSLKGGRVVVTGMGKAGLIGQKISATLASTGTPSNFLHPAEALHGDLGRVVREDVILMLSNSGETEEIIRLLQPLKRMGTPIIAITGRRGSTLARYANVLLDIGRIDEACPLGLAPSASTTAILALGDALALTVCKNRDFDAEHYAMFHPGGSLGRRLLKVREIMRTGAQCPAIGSHRSVREAIIAITQVPAPRAGAICVVEEDGTLSGIFTDGDLRRALAEDREVDNTCIGELMTRDPLTIGPDQLASEAFGLMHHFKYDELPVVEEGQLVGILDVQDLLELGMASTE